MSVTLILHGVSDSGDVNSLFWILAPGWYSAGAIDYCVVHTGRYSDRYLALQGVSRIRINNF